MKNNIPKKYEIYFWDTKFDELDIVENKRYIISRLLNKGDLEELIWLRKIYNDDDFIDVAKQRRDLDPKVANYLKNKYNLRKKEMKYYTMVDRRLWR